MSEKTVSTYRGCRIIEITGVGYAWEECIYGAQSDDAFATIAECKANIADYFGPGPAPCVINDEVYA